MIFFGIFPRSFFNFFAVTDDDDSSSCHHLLLLPPPPPPPPLLLLLRFMPACIVSTFTVLQPTKRSPFAGTKGAAAGGAPDFCRLAEVVWRVTDMRSSISVLLYTFFDE
jgi:hypothetical protein